MRVVIVAHTTTNPLAMMEATNERWMPPDNLGDDASELSEFAGRTCYQSWNRPNPETATTWGYINNIISQGHLSVLEHGSVTFHVSDVSRSLTHELIRHRHFSYSQFSQRYGKAGAESFIVPPLFAPSWEPDRRNPISETQGIVEDVWRTAIEAYDKLVAIWLPRLIQEGVDPHTARKRAREAARCVLPNMTPTSIVVTGNHRSWREFLDKRATPQADAEIRQLAMEIYGQLCEIEPAIYQDYRILPDEAGLTRAVPEPPVTVSAGRDVHVAETMTFNHDRG